MTCSQCDRPALDGQTLCDLHAEIGARPAKPEWIQFVIDQCHEAGVPCWTKALPPGVEVCREAPEPIAAILRREGMMT